MPGQSGIEVARLVARTAPDTAVILYTAFGDRALLTEALDAGARGFVLKEAPLAEVVRAVELVASGRTYVDPVLAGVLSSSAATEKMTNLTQRERDVLRLLADGMSNEEIGKSLFISPGDGAHARAQGDGEARRRHADAGRRDGAATVADRLGPRSSELGAPTRAESSWRNSGAGIAAVSSAADSGR